MKHSGNHETSHIAMKLSLRNQCIELALKDKRNLVLFVIIQGMLSEDFGILLKDCAPQNGQNIRSGGETFFQSQNSQSTVKTQQIPTGCPAKVFYAWHFKKDDTFDMSKATYHFIP